MVKYDTDDSGSFSAIATKLAEGIESQGHDVTVIDARTEAGRSLTQFEYICVGAAAPSLMAKSVPAQIGEFVRAAGMVSGKRCYAFIGKKGLRKGRFLASLMKTMESEGMYLKRSDILSHAEEAKAVGARLHIEKKSASRWQ